MHATPLSLLHVRWRVRVRVPREQLYEPFDNLQEAVAKFAEDALLAGQGNSGTVLSHFFISLSKELQAAGGAAKVTVAAFASALEKCGATVHNAFPADKVKEGTIVSVVRKSTLLHQGAFSTLKEMVDVWEAQAKTALYETPDELEVDGVYVLKEARAKVTFACMWMGWVSGVVWCDARAWCWHGRN